ncbi:MAG: hypothetical protein JRD93_13875 [Deltaproteobacteria bacterium]|nr:hypothetical protein [Deltaproteobacteria bacterium]
MLDRKLSPGAVPWDTDPWTCVAGDFFQDKFWRRTGGSPQQDLAERNPALIIISEENLRDLHERLRDNRYVVLPGERELYRPYQPRTRNIH